MNKSNTPLTHKALSQLLSVSVTTIKSYRRKFPDCIPVANSGKPIQFAEEAVAVCTVIRDLFEQGYSVEAAREELAKQFSWVASEMPVEEKEATQVGIELPKVYTNAMSNMAETLVSLTQKQNMMLTRFDQAVSKGGDVPAASICSGNGKATPAGTTLQAPRPVWLDEFANLCASLEQSVKLLQSIPTQINKAAQLLATASGGNEDIAGQSLASHENIVHSETHAVNFAPQSQQSLVKPNKEFLSLPLMVVTEGKVVRDLVEQACGARRGRFTCHDIDAVLRQATAYGRRFTLEWHEVQKAWWFTVNEAGQQNAVLSALMQEITGSSNQRAVIVTKLYVNGKEQPVTDLYHWIAQLRESIVETTNS